MTSTSHSGMIIVARFHVTFKKQLYTHEITYIGKGSQVKDLNIIRVSIPKETLEEILKDHMVDYDGNEYLVFEVASLKEPDQYGKTHAAHISKNVSESKGRTYEKPKFRKEPLGSFF